MCCQRYQKYKYTAFKIKILAAGWYIEDYSIQVLINWKSCEPFIIIYML